MKKIILTLLLITSLTFSGCAMTNNRHDIEDTNLVRVFGIDLKDGKYTVTMLYNIPTSPEGEKKYDSATGTGSTIYEAFNKAQMMNEKFILLSQARFFIIGEDAAKSGLENCIDFAIRNEAIKNDALCLISTSKDAKDLIEESKDEDSFLGDSLESIQNKEETIVKGINSTLDSMQKHFSSKDKAFLVSHLNKDENIYISGYCVFKDGKLADILDKDTSRGIDYITANIKSSPIYVQGEFATETINLKTKREIEVKDKTVNLTLKTEFMSAIREVTKTNENGAIDDYGKKQGEYINYLMNKAFSYVKESGNDVIEVQTLLKAKCPDEWKNIEKDFNVSDINYTLETKAVITKPFNLETRVS